jgi:hypothetical protein
MAQTDLLIFDTTIAKLDKKKYFIPSGELISFNKKFLKITPDNIFHKVYVVQMYLIIYNKKAKYQQWSITTKTAP